jgi:hypothetical protein
MPPACLELSAAEAASPGPGQREPAGPNHAETFKVGGGVSRCATLVSETRAAPPERRGSPSLHPITAGA